MFKEKKAVARKIASVEQNLSHSIDDKLFSIYQFYLIGVMNRSVYHQMAAKTQIAELEKGLLDHQHSYEDGLLKLKVAEFAQESNIKSDSMSGLIQKLGLQIGKPEVKIDLARAVAEAQTSKNYQSFEKSIEHLSHVMKIKFRQNARGHKTTTNLKITDSRSI